MTIKDDDKAEDEPLTSDEAGVVESKSNHPPKEVSHFKQADIKKWLKRSWWRDHALPNDPSYNDAD